MREGTSDELKLLDEITDEELGSLECPTYDEQEAAWQQALAQLTRANLERLLDTIGFDLVHYQFFTKSSGVINKIFVLDVRRQGTSDDDDDDGEHRREMILRIANPHKFWERGRTENEVAVLKYVAKNTSIPVPRIWSYSIDKTISFIGCQYILMDKLPGVTLNELLDSFNRDPKEVPNEFLERLLKCVGELASIAPFNMDRTRIGFLDSDLRTTRLLQDGCPVEPCETFHAFIDQQLVWCVKEMRKFAKYATTLANELEQMRNELAELVATNPDLDKLNFGDSMSFSHGDLNSGNILVDAESWQLTGVIDWDFCSHGFDCHQFGFVQDWFDTHEQREAIKERVATITRHLPWVRNPRGLSFRRFLFTFANDANQIGFYCSSWFDMWKNPHLGVRVHIDTYAGCVREALKRWPTIASQLKSYTLHSGLNREN